MSKKGITLVLLAVLGALLVPAPAAAQTSSLHFENWVTVEYRHCQDYAHRDWRSLWMKKAVDAKACAADPGTLFNRTRQHNSIPDIGFDVVSAQISGTASATAVCKWIAVSNSSLTPAAGDTTLTGELAVNGLSRAAGTYAHTGGTKVFTIQKVFTASGTQASQSTGLFDAASTGNLCAEVNYTGGAVTVNNGDTLTVTWTWTLS